MADNAPTVDVPSTGDKIRYQVDRFLSWSPVARFVGLFGLSFLLISTNAVIVKFLMPVDQETAPVEAVQALLQPGSPVALDDALKEAIDTAVKGASDGKVALAFLDEFGDAGKKLKTQLTAENHFNIFQGYWWATTRVFDAGTMGDDDKNGLVIALLG